MLVESETYVLRIDIVGNKVQAESGVSAENSPYRLTLRHVDTGARRSFPTLAALVAFLESAHQSTTIKPPQKP